MSEDRVGLTEPAPHDQQSEAGVPQLPVLHLGKVSSFLYGMNEFLAKRYKDVRV